MQQGPYANLSISSLSLDQSKRSDSPNGKITPAVLFPLMPIRHFCYGKKYLFIWLVGQDTFPHLASSEMSTWVRPWM